MRRRRRLMRWAQVLIVLVVLAGGAAVVYGLRPDPPPPRPVDNDAFRSPNNAASPAVVWAVGDGADGSDIARAVARRIEAGRPDRVLYLGDVYDSGSPADFRSGYEPVYGRLKRITAPTPGNHDWPAHPEGYDQYWQRASGAPTPPWYSFEIGGWRIISLNSEAPHAAGSQQVRWLQRELARSRGTCVLAFWHRPLESAGRHGDQGDVEPFFDALRGRARLVVNGHDHDLQRLRPRDGITQLIAGAGGKSHYGLDDDDRVVFGDDQTDGALRMRLRPGRADLAFVAVDGTILDRSTATCSPART